MRDSLIIVKDSNKEQFHTMSGLGCVHRSASDEGILDDACDLKIGTSLEDESQTNMSNDSDMGSYYNHHVISFTDDSGFNSDSENRDYLDESILCTNYDFDSQVKKVKKLNMNCLRQSDEALPQGNIRLAMRLKSVTRAKSHMKPDLALLSNKLREVDSEQISNRQNISTKHETPRQRQSSVTTSVVYDVAVTSRTNRRSRLNVQDLNNNTTSSRNLNSFLKKAPFKLQDCFHNQGILSLIACIIYGLALMVIIGFLSMVMASIKSYIGTQNLRTMRTNIIRRRHAREHMAAG